MPLIGTFGAGAAKGFGQTRGAGTPYNVQYLIVGGGGGAGNGYGGGGGGAGGFRTIASKTFEVVTKTNYTVTVGIGGISNNAPPSPTYDASGNALPGGDSIMVGEASTITSTGGGYGGNDAGGPTGVQADGGDGGSGGGGSSPWQSNINNPGGSGNTPPVTPSQGNGGGSSANQGIPNRGAGGGGGGAGGAGSNAPTGSGGSGGTGTADSITGSSITYAGGGGGAGMGPGTGRGSGGSGGGGNGGAQVPTVPGTSGTDGLGGGCGGGFYSAPSSNIRGGNGVVIIRRVTADSDSASGGSVTTDGSDTIHTFNASGTYTG